jgi:NADH-quinone oxidoreductase subunit C
LAPDEAGTPDEETTGAIEEQSGAGAVEEAVQSLAENDEPAAAAEARAQADAPGAAPTDESAPAGAPLSDDAAALLAALRDALGADAIVEHASMAGELVVRVRRDDWHRAAEVARRALDLDYLSFLSAIDWLPRPEAGGDDDAGGDTSSPVQPSEMTFGVAGSDGRFQVLAVVESTRRRRELVLKCDVDESDMTVSSWVDVYPGADWHERECWEMYGISFDGHGALRHLYLPSEFEGHPLRKDFPLLAREVKPWPGLVDVEGMPGDDEPAEPAEVEA